MNVVQLAPMTLHDTRTYSLLNYAVSVQGVETASTLAGRLDALLGSAVSDERHDARRGGSTFTLRREGAIWRLAEQGNEIPSTPLHTEEDVAQFLEWLICSEAVRHAAPSLILHSGAVVRNGIALLLPNVSGAGKTTLTLALAARGWLPLTDDICPQEERNGEFVAIGCRRCCHLSEASRAILQAHDIPLEGPLAGLDDYYRPLRWAEPAPVRGIVIPRYVADSPTHFAAISQAECLGQLIRMLFTEGATPWHTRRHIAARLAARTPGFSLTYSDLGEAFRVFESLEALLAADRSPESGAHLSDDREAETL